VTKCKVFSYKIKKRGKIRLYTAQGPPLPQSGPAYEEKKRKSKKRNEQYGKIRFFTLNPTARKGLSRILSYF
jgi:hypothetical protein